MTDKKIKVRGTADFVRMLFDAPDVREFIENYSDEMQIPAFHEYITDLCKATDQIPEHVIKNASIERTYGHQLFNGTRKPSRDKVIQLAFGFGLNEEETHKLLKIAKQNPLYPKIKRDAVILYCIHHNKDIFETQSVLHSLGLTLLGDK